MQRKRKNNHLLFKLWILSFVMAACSESEDASVTDSIAFGVKTVTKGRAATLIGGETEDAFRAQPFAVFGDWKDSQEGAPLEEVFDNVSVAYDGKAPSGWNYTPVQRWKTNGWYDFRAYWPAGNPIENTSNAQTLALEYNMQTQNEDLMVAYTGCPTRSNPVTLNFRHALAAVAVKFKTETTTSTYKIKSLFFTSLYYIGTLPYNSKEDEVLNEWQYAERSAVDALDITKSIRLREWTSDEGREVTTSADDYPEEYDLFLPQSLVVEDGIAKPSLTFTVEIWQDDINIDTATITVVLPNTTTWEAGKKYIYEVTVKPEAAEITVNTTLWDEVNVSVGDIEF